MNRLQIANRVQIEADARLGETVERLLLLLDMAQEIESNVAKYVTKWAKCGLLSNIPEDKQGEAAKALEHKALHLIGETSGAIAPYTPAWEAYVVKELRDTARQFVPRSQRPVRLCYCEECHPFLCENCCDS
jgi:hypothetical protein